MQPIQGRRSQMALPRVVPLESGQPWAKSCNPFGIARAYENAANLGFYSTENSEEPHYFMASPPFPPNFGFSDGLFSRRERGAERGLCAATYCQTVTFNCAKKGVLPFLRHAISSTRSFLRKLFHHLLTYRSGREKQKVQKVRTPAPARLNQELWLETEKHLLESWNQRGKG